MPRRVIGYVMVFIMIWTVSISHAYRVSSGFGWRIHPIKKTWLFHTGIDISMPHGAPVAAIKSGIVVWAAPYKGYGKTILLCHAKNVYTLYGHCSALSVTPGQSVDAGQVIAKAGNTGMSTGPHLHLEYWVDHRYINPLVLWESKKTTSGVKD